MTNQTMEATRRVDHSQMKLGKAPPRHDARTLQLEQYLRDELPAPPEAVNWGAAVKTWPVMANLTTGDCTCAAAGHLIQLWTANVGKEVVLGDKDILAAYSALTGYNPRTGVDPDRPVVVLDTLNYWRRKGIGKHKIQAFAALEPGNLDHVRTTIQLFGGCYIGLAMPLSARTQQVWSIPSSGTKGPGAPASWGGHAVPVVAYDRRGLTVVTWGALKRMTWEFWMNYCEEAYALLSLDWLKTNQRSISGVDLVTLRQDLKSVTG